MNVILRREPAVSLFDELFSDVFTRAGWQGARNSAQPGASLARLDVIDRGDQYAIQVDLPGVKKEDIRVTIEGARVAIAAETKSESEAKAGERVLHSERRATSYARSFELPVEVTEDSAEASFENGVLHLNLPKRAPVGGRRLTVN